MCQSRGECPALFCHVIVRFSDLIVSSGRLMHLPVYSASVVHVSPQFNPALPSCVLQVHMSPQFNPALPVFCRWWISSCPARISRCCHPLSATGGVVCPCSMSMEWMCLAMQHTLIIPLMNHSDRTTPTYSPIMYFLIVCVMLYARASYNVEL